MISAFAAVLLILVSDDVTAVLLRLCLDAGEVEIVNAGHNPAAMVLPDCTLRMIAASGTPLGMLPAMRYSVERLAFPAPLAHPALHRWSDRGLLWF